MPSASDFNDAITKVLNNDMLKSCMKSSRTGRKKVSYSNQEDAAFEAELVSKQLDKIVTAYRCRYCDKWHIGHGNGRQKIEAGT